ncbi:MAG: hypothetical protein FWE24_09235 [Defluviitaleaceae bacterium]|nr:hypothetical protein [Defluviitaleaceae bacterium]
MNDREYIKTQIDTLPEQVLEKVLEFIAFQKFTLGLYEESEDDTEYLLSIPGMEEKIDSALEEPLSESVPISKVWSDV